MFQKGEKVTWKSSGGRSGMKQKTGVIIVVVPVGQSPSPCDKRGRAFLKEQLGDNWPQLYASKISDGSGRNHESYVVAVPGKTTKSRPILYWPRVSGLSRGEE